MDCLFYLHSFKHYFHSIKLRTFFFLIQDKRWGWTPQSPCPLSLKKLPWSSHSKHLQKSQICPRENSSKILPFKGNKWHPLAYIMDTSPLCAFSKTVLNIVPDVNHENLNLYCQLIIYIHPLLIIREQHSCSLFYKKSIQWDMVLK